MRTKRRFVHCQNGINCLSFRRLFDANIFSPFRSLTFIFETCSHVFCSIFPTLFLFLLFFLSLCGSPFFCSNRFDFAKYVNSFVTSKCTVCHQTVHRYYPSTYFYYDTPFLFEILKAAGIEKANNCREKNCVSKKTATHFRLNCNQMFSSLPHFEYITND